MLDLFSQIENPERDEIILLRRQLEEANYQYYVLIDMRSNIEPPGTHKSIRLSTT